MIDYILMIDTWNNMYGQNLINTWSAVLYKLNSSFAYLHVSVQLHDFGSSPRFRWSDLPAAGW